MHLRDDIGQLRQYLDDLADCNDDDLTRYQLLRPPMPPGVYWRARWLAGRILRWLEARRLKKPNHWPAALKRNGGSGRSKPLLIWAVGMERETLRTACRGFAEMPIISSGFAPVLVTDVADFAFFSRLGWLVEYLPVLSGEGQLYEKRKARFLARLYRGAPALPVSAALGSNAREEIRRCLASGHHAND